MTRFEQIAGPATIVSFLILMNMTYNRSTGGPWSGKDPKEKLEAEEGPILWVLILQMVAAVSFIGRLL